MPGLLSTDWAFSGAPIPDSRLSNNLITYQYCATERKIMIVEGPYEPWHVIDFDVDPNVIQIEAQPLKIQDIVNGKRLTYTFDLKILLRSTESIHFEFKTEKDLITYSNGVRAPRKWDLISQWSQENGIYAEFRTETALKEKSVYLQNWRRMLRSIQQFQKESRPDVENSLSEFMTVAGETSLREVLSRISNYPSTIVQGCLYEGIRTGKYECDLTTVIFHLDSPVSLVRK